MDPRANNKVLSVSYGNFSCSVQGFDDSFEVMTSVVEFFRALAQEDRYFGAAPVQLTPELIAELSRKTQNADIQVAQGTGETGYNVTLREPSAPQMPAAAASSAFALNERLKRLREAENSVTTDDENDLDTIVADPAPVAASTPLVDMIAEPEPEAAPMQTADAQEDAETNVSDETTDNDTAGYDTADVASNDNAADPHDVDDTTGSDTHLPETADAAPAPPSQPQASVSQPTEPQTDAPALTLEQRLRRIQAVTQRKRAEQSAAATQKLATPDPEPNTPQHPTATDSDTFILRNNADNAHSDGDGDADQPVTQDMEPDIAREDRAGTTHIVQVETPSPVDDLDAAADDTSDDQAVDVPNIDQDPSSETTEPEEAPISLRQAPETGPKGVLPKRPERPTTRSSRNAENLERPSSEMLRLLKTAKEHMDEPETHRKRNALEHLRAAVAATLADNSILSRDKTKRERDSTSEDNIAPRRPVKPKPAATDVPVTPLVLQMDQRIDLDQSRSTTPDAGRA